MRSGRMNSETLAAPEELLDIDYRPPKKGWMEPTVEFKKGTYCYGAPLKHQKYLGLPNPREWQPPNEDWQLPENWKETILEGMEERLNKYRSFRLFMDICVRCGACADKCHFFIGTGDPKNMPVLRAELIRSVYRKHFTLSGKLFGKMGGARELTEDVLKEWFYYFYQCTECRRCSVYCPYGIDTCEITMMGWIIEPASNCFRTGNHLGIPPHAFKDTVDFAVDEIEELTGIKVEASVNRKGAEVLIITPSADYFASPHWYTFLGYMMLFHEIGLDYTWSAYASEGGNFGLFHSEETVKWILGGECGHMWRVIHQYMDTLNGPADFLEEPVSPITGTKFENAKSTKMVHICEFTADLMYNNKLRLDPSRNDHWKLTFHDSCNPARGMGLIEEPRYVINNVCNNFYEMPENTIKERTFCCGSGSGLGADENLEMRLRGGLPSGIHELVGNALVMKGQKDRPTDLRGTPLKEEEN
jgi:Fe-S oxidoreductase